MSCRFSRGTHLRSRVRHPSLTAHTCLLMWQDKMVQWFDSKKVFYLALMPLVAFYALYAGDVSIQS